MTDQAKRIIPTPPKVLTLTRIPDGRLIPYIDDIPIMGCMDVTVNTNNGQQYAQLIFNSALVHFNTQHNPINGTLH